MAKKFLTDIDIAGGIYDSSGDIGNSGQVLSSTGSGLNWIDSTANSSVIYQDAFSGNGSATAFTLANSVDNENKTQVYIDGVYQFKNTYSISGTTLTFSAAPPNSTDIEVISFNSITADGDILTDSEFGSAGLMTTNGSGVYSITTNNSSNWNTAYTHSQAAHAPANAEQNVQSDWTATSGDSFIQNKPTIPSGNQIIDWTADQGSTEIHSGNYINTTYTVGDGGLTQNNFTNALKTKLDGIETSADVTDVTNVTAAGALMDSEVTNLADVKAFDTTDYATAAQGALADSAQQPPSEGAFANGDKTKLDGIEASADVTDTTNVTAAGALMDSELTDLAGVKAVTISDLATETYVDTAVSNLVDSSPATLNTLNELADALGDDANFSTTVTNSIATKLPLAGGTLTGDLTLDDGAGASPRLILKNSSDETWEIFNGTHGILNFYENSDLRLSFAQGGNATFTGTITASGYNDTNWNTAYSWGDHSTEGYLTSSTGFPKGTDIPGSANLNSYTSPGYYHQNGNSNATSGTNYPANLAGMLTVTADGVMVYQTYQGYGVNHTWERKYYNGTWYSWHQIYDSGVFTNNSANWNTAYGWGDHASGGYAADNAVVKLATTQTISGDKTFTSLDNTYSGHFYWTPYNVSGAHYPHFLDGSNASGVDVNWRLYTGSSNSHTHVWNTTKARFVTRVESSIDMRTPIFYDIDDTNYFLNPNNISELRHLKLKAAGDLDLYVTDNDAWVHCDARDEGSVAALYKYTRSTSTGYGYYREYWYDGNSYQSIRCIGDTFEFSSKISTSNGNLEINALDEGGAPAMTSQFTMKGYEGRGIGIKMKDNVHSASGSNDREWFVGSGYNTSNFNIGYSASGSQSSYPAQAMLNISTNGNVIATASLRAPIFYDTDNTDYYTNPAGDSVMNQIHLDDYIRHKGDLDTYMGFNGSNSWKLHVGGGDRLIATTSQFTSNLNVAAPIYYDKDSTAHYIHPGDVSNLSGLNIEYGNIDLRYAHTVDMTGSGYNQSTYYPVRIYVSDITRIRIENRLNAGGTHPGWATHGSGFSLLMDWYTNGSGWGTVGVTRTIRQWNEAWTNVTICGGITQMSHSSAEIVWLRGGGKYLIKTSFNNTVQVQTSAYTANSQTVTPTTSIVNDVWSAASASSAQQYIYAQTFYDANDSTYYINPAGANSALFKGILNFHTAAGNPRGYIQATDTNDAHFIIATSGGEDISFRDGGVGGNVNMIIRGDGDVLTFGNNYGRIWYDYDNSGYYINPNGTSKLAGLEFSFTQHGSANNIRMGNSTTMNAISSGTNNVALGVEALGACSSGSRNFATGYAALQNLTSGGSNIAMGDATGYNVSSGSNNLLFGQNAGRTGFQSPYQSIAGVSTASNQIHMGNESHSTARIQISWTVNSDARDKTDVTPINVGLDFVKDLNPVTFRWDKRSDYEDRTPTGENKLEELTLGFLAQEVEEVEKSYGYDVANKTNLVVDRDVEQDHFGITYEKMIPILTKAIQELEARVKELENN